MTTESIESAIKRAGGIVAFARFHNVTHQAVSLWRKRGFMPFDRATDTEVGFGVPRETLVDERTAAAYLTPPSGGLL